VLSKLWRAFQNEKRCFQSAGEHFKIKNIAFETLASASKEILYNNRFEESASKELFTPTFLKQLLPQTLHLYK